VDEVLIIRPPGRFRAFVVAYCTACIAFLALGLTVGVVHGAWGALVVAIPIAGLAALAVRGTSLQATVEGENLIVRNWLSTRCFNRVSIRAFRLGGSAAGPGRNAIQVVDAHGVTHPISASVSPWYLNTRAEQGRWMSNLQGWLSRGDEPITAMDTGRP
jgi:hypothetical protein